MKGVAEMSDDERQRSASFPPLSSEDTQMRDETLFVYPPKEESGALQNVLIPAGAVPAHVEEVQLTEAITELVKAGLGVAILARASQKQVVNVAQHGGICGVLVSRTRPAVGTATETILV